MNNATPLLAAALAAATYLAVTAEPDTTEATTVAVAPTHATPAAAATLVPVEPQPTLAVRWFRSDAEAWTESQRTGRPHVRLVTSPTNCAACVRLEAGPLSDAETVTWLNANYVMTRRRPYAGERISIPAFEVRTGPRSWRVFNAPTFENGPFRRWLRSLFQ